MVELFRVGDDWANLKRLLYTAPIRSLDDWPSTLPVPTPPFVAFVAFDVTDVPGEAQQAFATKLIAQGCGFVGLWGGAEPLDHVFDVLQVEAAEAGEPWQEHFDAACHEESLDDALWYALFGFSHPWEDNSRWPFVAISQREWVDDIASRLADVRSFSDRAIRGD